MDRKTWIIAFIVACIASAQKLSAPQAMGIEQLAYLAGYFGSTFVFSFLFIFTIRKFIKK